jgi:hypothetical protein
MDILKKRRYVFKEENAAAAVVVNCVETVAIAIDT